MKDRDFKLIDRIEEDLRSSLQLEGLSKARPCSDSCELQAISYELLCWKMIRYLRELMEVLDLLENLTGFDWRQHVDLLVDVMDAERVQMEERFLRRHRQYENDESR